MMSDFCNMQNFANKETLKYAITMYLFDSYWVQLQHLQLAKQLRQTHQATYFKVNQYEVREDECYHRLNTLLKLNTSVYLIFRIINLMVLLTV